MDKLFFYITILVLLTSCATDNAEAEGKIRIVTTTSIITDLVENIGGDKVYVQGLMGPGVDPHLYKASEGDVMKFANAELIIYGGLHLEGKLVSVFEKIEKLGKTPIDLGVAIPVEKLRASDEFGGNYDPHIWFDISLFKEQAKAVANALTVYQPTDSIYFQTQLHSYLEKLSQLEVEVEQTLASLPKNKRRLVTAHDAFSYFGLAYEFDVVGLQGLSTATEAGVRDVMNVSDYIVKHKIKSIFLESSVPPRTIEALQQAVKAKGHDVKIGGMLFSDALGTKGSEEDNYLGMIRYNVKTIVEGLNGK